MTFLSRLLARDDNERARLIRDLHALRLDWLVFRNKVVSVFALLHLQVPCHAFLSAPSPETLVESTDALLDTDIAAANELRHLVVLASLENAIRELTADAPKQRAPYLYFLYAIQHGVTEYAGVLANRESRVPPGEWLAAFLSASAGSRVPLPVDQACKSLAFRFGTEHDPSFRMGSR